MTKIQYMTKLLLFVACAAMVLTGCVRREEPELVSLEQERADTSGEASAGTSSISESTSASKGKKPADTESEESLQKNTESTITVYVCGAVANPGVYVLSGGSRVCDAVESAGGFSENADPSYLNQAEYVQDAQKIEIPTVEQAGELRAQAPLQDAGIAAAEGAGQESGDEKISINDADVTQLMLLPGIGEGKAKAIIEYREKNGRFGSLEDLMQVPGIKQASFDKLKDRIKL